MNKAMIAVAMTALTTIMLFGSSALAVGGSDQPIRERIQERMLERFGEESIDANNDGMLTREEVRAFRMGRQPTATENGRDSARGGHEHGMQSRDRSGWHTRGAGPRGQMNRVGMMLHRLDVLDSETAPEGFNIDRAPGADLDGDGVLSDAEWVEFAQQKWDEILGRILEHHPAIDIDANGAISDEELESFRAGYVASFRDRILTNHPEADVDGDGAISDEELEVLRAARKAEHIERMLDRHPEADIDGDGDLSDDELSELRESMFGDGSGERRPWKHRGRR